MPHKCRRRAGSGSAWRRPTLLCLVVLLASWPCSDALRDVLQVSDSLLAGEMHKSVSGILADLVASLVEPWAQWKLSLSSRLSDGLLMSDVQRNSSKQGGSLTQRQASTHSRVSKTSGSRHTTMGLPGVASNGAAVDNRTALEQQAQPPEPNNSKSFETMLFALGGGTGASVRDPVGKKLNWDLERRMRYQDNAVILLLTIVYFITLFFGLSFSYWQSVNLVPVTYYADPRLHAMVSQDHTLSGFLESFNQSPKSVQLQVTGFIPVQHEVDGSIQWLGHHYFVAFTFALDLSPWVVRVDDRRSNDESTPGPNQPTLEHGIHVEDLADLRHFLATNNNDLASIEMEKQVSWDDWEELATNIKHQIRQCGFPGVIGINRNDSEKVLIYKNKSWANFMHSRLTKVICALSLLGWLLYLPYMWLRCSKLVVRSCFRIDVSIGDYWQLIQDKLSANGFVADTGPDPLRSPMLPANLPISNFQGAGPDLDAVRYPLPHSQLGQVPRIPL